MKILKKGGGVVEKRREEETKSMPHAPVVYSSGVLSLMKNDKMSKRKKAITDYFMQNKKLNKGEEFMKTCQIMLFGVGIALYTFFFLLSVVICVNERRKFSVLR